MYPLLWHRIPTHAPNAHTSRAPTEKSELSVFPQNQTRPKFINRIVQSLSIRINSTEVYGRHIAPKEDTYASSGRVHSYYRYRAQNCKFESNTSHVASLVLIKHKAGFPLYVSCLPTGTDRNG
ncbi:hypothetical protein QTP88_028173 [Uroleucon formosanum]